MARLNVGILWQLGKNAKPAEELELAASRFQERTGQAANAFECNVDDLERFEGLRLPVSSSRHVLRRTIWVGRVDVAESQVQERPVVTLALPKRPVWASAHG